jgi:DNA polymerase III alpha subunit
MWPDDYVRYKDIVEEDKIVFVAAVVERNRDEPSLQITRVLTMEQGQKERTTGLVLLLDMTADDDADARRLDAIAGALRRSPRGNCPVFLYVRDGGGKWLRMKAGDDFKINPATLVKADLDVILGPGRVEFSRQGNGNGRQY